MTETLAERKRRERQQKLEMLRRRQRMQLAAVAGALAAVVVLAVVFLNSSYFEVRTVTIEGAAHVPAVTLERARAIGLGSNIIRYPSARVAALLTRNPWVREATVRRRWPNEVVVKVVERTPEYSIFDGIRYYLVASDGVVLKVSETPETSVQIADLPVKKLEVGDTVTAEEFAQAVRIVRKLPADLRKGLTVVSARSLERITLYVNGVEVLYGMAEHEDEKNVVLREIFSREGTSVISIDVRVPTNPVVKGKP